MVSCVYAKKCIPGSLHTLNLGSRCQNFRFDSYLSDLEKGADLQLGCNVFPGIFPELTVFIPKNREYLAQISVRSTRKKIWGKKASGGAKRLQGAPKKWRFF